MEEMLIAESIDGFVFRLDSDCALWIDSERISPALAAALRIFFDRVDVDRQIEDWISATEQTH